MEVCSGGSVSIANSLWLCDCLVESENLDTQQLNSYLTEIEAVDVENGLGVD